MHLRRANASDARALAELLNEIILLGGTTAMTTPLSRADMTGWITADAARASWLMAESEAGEALGFQTIGPHDGLPADACDIATFTRTGKAQIGIGSALFARTQEAARKLGYLWINATVRRENSGGLIYYKSRGFEPFKQDQERLFLRYDLR